MSYRARQRAKELLADEVGTIYKVAPHSVVLVYPSPYHTAMSSLGYQTIYRLINALPDTCAERAMLPDDVPAYRETGAPLLSLETGKPVGDFAMIGFSVAYELEIGGVIDCLELAGIPVLAADRDDSHPLIFAGGPLTFSNPAPLAPFFDVICMGEGEEITAELINEAAACNYRSERVQAALCKRPGFYVPNSHGEQVPAIAKAANTSLPARSQIITPNTELRSMFMTEAARGCSRGCTYCVMRRSTNGGMRMVSVSDVIAGIPEHAKRVGLVGAAVTDHPHIRDIVRAVVDGGRGIGISSLRADKLDDELVGLLAKGGYRTLTVAGDGASQRVRDAIERKATEANLIRSAELAKQHKLIKLKVYMMVGVPSETDADIDELIRFSLELSKVHPRIALGIAPFVAKRNTPMDGTDFAGIRVIDNRLKRLRKGLRGRVIVRPTSARWAWVEYMLAQGESNAGLAVMDAHRAGGSFADYKKAFAARSVEPTGPRARVPSTAELIALRRSRRPT